MIPCFGLYFGTTNLCLAIHKDGVTEVLANAAGDRVTPAIVAFMNGEKSVGLAAKQGMYRNASNTITRVKRLIGGNADDIENESKISRCKVVNEGEVRYEIEQDGVKKCYSPFEIIVALFQTMKEIAKSHSHDEDTYPTVVTVPLNFSANQRNIIQEAAIKAGFELLRIISEPAAAALSYGIGQDSDSSDFYCLVYRMGGTSVDVSVIHVIGGMYNIVSCVQRSSFGGGSFTDSLVDFCIQEFQRQNRYNVRENKRSLMKLQSAAETCKHVLSMLGVAQCFAESLYEGIDLNINISRARFESLISGSLQQCFEPILEALDTAHVQKENIGKVVLVGGSCKIPKLQSMISDMFQSASILNSISPDEVIAVGAAEEAAIILEGVNADVEEEYFVKALSRDLHVKVLDNKGASTLHKVLPKGSIVPARSEHVFTVSDTQTSLCFEIYEGNENLQDDDLLPTTLVSKVAFSKLCGSKVTAVFQLKDDYSLHITCTDESDNVESLTVSSGKNGTLPPQENGDTHVI